MGQRPDTVISFALLVFVVCCAFIVSSFFVFFYFPVSSFVLLHYTPFASPAPYGKLYESMTSSTKQQ